MPLKGKQTERDWLIDLILKDKGFKQKRSLTICLLKHNKYSKGHISVKCNGKANIPKDKSKSLMANPYEKLVSYRINMVYWKSEGRMNQNRPTENRHVKHKEVSIAVGSGDSSVVRAPDSWSKGRGFESLLERRENFLLQCQLSVLTLISVSVPPPCYRSST